MRIKKNIEKTKAQGFNVWDVTTTISEIAIVVLFFFLLFVFIDYMYK